MTVKEAYVRQVGEAVDTAIAAVKEIINRSGSRISGKAEGILQQLIALGDEVGKVDI